MPDGDATIARWTRKWEKVEENDKKAEEGMKDAIRGAMRDADTKRNISKELLRARQGSDPLKPRSAWGDDGEEFTGIHEDRPWERD